MAPSTETQPDSRPDATKAARNLEHGHDWNDPSSPGNQSMQSEVNGIRTSFIDKQTHRLDEAGYRAYVREIHNTMVADARSTHDPHLPDLVFDFDQAERKEPCVVPPGDSTTGSVPGTHIETKDGWEITSDQSGAPKQVKKGDVVAKLPEGASDVAIKNGLPTFKTKAGVDVELDEKGTPKAFHSGGFSVERHDDQQWYYHQDSGGDYVKLSGFKMNQDGTVTATEGGFGNNGRQHTLTGSGESTENAFSSKLRNLGKAVDISDLKNGIENGSIRDLQRFGARNAGLVANPAVALAGLAADSANGSNTYGVQSSMMTGVAKTLVDGTINGAGWLLGHGQFALAQWGLEEAGLIPKMPRLDQLIPESNLIPTPDTNAPPEERTAFKVGEVAGFFVPFAGQAGDAIRAPRAIISAVREGRVFSSLGDGVSSFVAKFKDPLQTPKPEAVPKPADEEAPRYTAPSPFDTTPTESIPLPRGVPKPTGAVELPNDNWGDMNAFRQVANGMLNEAKLPPVAPGNIRVYRGVIDKAAETEFAPRLSEQEEGRVRELIQRMAKSGIDPSAPGLTPEEQEFFDRNVIRYFSGSEKFYSDDPAVAIKYAAQSGSPGGQVYYLDIPTSELAKYAQVFAMQEGTSVGLPFELARQAKVLGHVLRGDDWVASAH